MAIRGSLDIKNLVRELAENKVSVLEILREALSNAKDHGASRVWLKTVREPQSGRVNLLISDDGDGMDEERLSAFWGVGASAKRVQQQSIGYKGHGTKLYFKCRRLRVATRTSGGSQWRLSSLDLPAEFDGEEIADDALADSDALASELEAVGLRDKHGTMISIEEIDFDDSNDLLDRTKIESYCDWFTVIGDIRSGLFDRRVEFHRAIATKDDVLDDLRRHEGDLRPLEVQLRINGEPAYAPIGRGRGKKAQQFFKAWTDDIEEFADQPGLLAYGHRFANAFASSSSKTRVRDDTSALRLTGPAEWSGNDGIAIVARVEGHRRQLQTYTEASWQGHPGIYGFEQRFGLWLCRDFIPIAPRSDLLRQALERALRSEFQYGFSNLRNWKVFVNLQRFRLTANRNEVSKQEQLEARIVERLTDVIAAARKRSGFQEWVLRLKSARIERKKDREVAQMQQRLEEMQEWTQRDPKPDSIDPSDVEGLTPLGDDYSLLLRTPRSEQELFYVYGLLSGRFQMPIHLIEYNASEGVDAIGILRQPKLLSQPRAHIRVELKLEIAANNPIHHFFDAIDVIICWQVNKGGDIYEQTSAESGKLVKRAKPVLSPPIDTYEIRYQRDDTENVIPVLEISKLFPKPKKRGRR
ncbi:MAG: hypothetical protein Tsb0020_40170 [Haliangiales bacterium]